LVVEFFKFWEDPDSCFDFCNLYDLLLECTDMNAREWIALFVKYALLVLRDKEKDILYEAEEY